MKSQEILSHFSIRKFDEGWQILIFVTIVSWHEFCFRE